MKKKPLNATVSLHHLITGAGALVHPYNGSMNTLSKAERRAVLVDLGDVRFENSFVRELPGDPELRNVPRASFG